jgi:hypothetical protein
MLVAGWSRASLGLEAGGKRIRPPRPPLNVVARARTLERALAELGTEADVARTHGMTRAGVSQYLAVARRLPANLLDGMEVETEPARLRRYSLRSLVEIAREEGEGKRRAKLRQLLS